MAHQIRKRPLNTPIEKPQKRIVITPYCTFINTLPCVVSWRQETEAAHVNGINRAWGHKGRGKGKKSSDCWVLPLHPDLHYRQGNIMGELQFWKEAKINPHAVCCALFTQWTLYKYEAHQTCLEIIKRAKEL